MFIHSFWLGEVYLSQNWRGIYIYVISKQISVSVLNTVSEPKRNSDHIKKIWSKSVLPNLKLHLIMIFWSYLDKLSLGSGSVIHFGQKTEIWNTVVPTKTVCETATNNSFTLIGVTSGNNSPISFSGCSNKTLIFNNCVLTEGKPANLTDQDYDCIFTVTFLIWRNALITRPRHLPLASNSSS